jgi:dephospho-CoA kinase
MVGAILEELGVPVIDTDRVCHDLMRVGRPLYRRVVAAFGQAILGAGGAIDRRALGRLVFADAGQLRRLNRLAHPAVIRTVNQWLAGQSAAPRRRRALAALVPLVFETGWDRAWDRVICVAAPAGIQMARLRQRGLSAAAARARIAAQWPVEEKMRRADFVVFNSGGRPCVRRQVLGIVRQIMRHRESWYGRNKSKR